MIMVELREEIVVQRSLTDRLVRSNLHRAGWPMTDYRREQYSYVSRTGGDEECQC